jgi:hypothetical protein
MKLPNEPLQRLSGTHTKNAAPGQHWPQVVGKSRAWSGQPWVRCVVLDYKPCKHISDSRPHFLCSCVWSGRWVGEFVVWRICFIIWVPQIIPLAVIHHGRSAPQEFLCSMLLWPGFALRACHCMMCMLVLVVAAALPSRAVYTFIVREKECSDFRASARRCGPQPSAGCGRRSGILRGAGVRCDSSIAQQ